MTIFGRLRRYFSRGARVLDPEAADRRAVAPQDNPGVAHAADTETVSHPPPAPHLRPDAAELEKEHRRGE